MVSVIMGIYNCETTLSDSIDSLLSQTYKDFEIIMCDDGSTDKTFEIARKYADMHDNIILLKNDKNRGLNYTLNYCLKFVHGEFIARHDGDDISLPNRFEKEMEILNASPSLSFVASNVIYFDEKGEFKTSRYKEYPEKIDFIRGNPFFHATCIFRKSILNDVDGYSESNRLLRVEDYHLFFKIYAKGEKGINIQEPLYKFRDNIFAYKRRNLKNRLNEVYVRFIGFRMLKLPLYCYILCIRPLLVLLLPGFVYNYFHRRNKS